MLVLINEWKIFSFLNSTHFSYTFGITSVSFLRIFCYWLHYHSLWLTDILMDCTAFDIINLKSPIIVKNPVALTLKHVNERFIVVYNLLSLIYNYRIQILLKLSTKFNSFFSLSALYNNANWLERELWDLFGLVATGNVDLRRLLTDYGFEGHPLRKDFPVIGFFEIFYNESFKRISYLPVEIPQEFRLFKFKV